MRLHRFLRKMSECRNHYSNISKDNHEKYSGSFLKDPEYFYDYKMEPAVILRALDKIAQRFY